MSEPETFVVAGMEWDGDTLTVTREDGSRVRFAGVRLDGETIAGAVNAALKSAPPDDRERFLRELRDGVDYCWECGSPFGRYRQCFCQADD